MIRQYKNTDRETLIALLRLNTPDYFDVKEEQDFIFYLDNEVEDYYVVELGSEVVGGGGINYFNEEKTACLSWDFLHPDIHGKGWGTHLVEFRMENIKKQNSFNTIEVNTSQLTYKFYEKCGFSLQEMKQDYWAKGYHLYKMRMEL